MWDRNGSRVLQLCSFPTQTHLRHRFGQITTSKKWSNVTVTTQTINKIRLRWIWHSTDKRSDKTSAAFPAPSTKSAGTVIRYKKREMCSWVRTLIRPRFILSRPVSRSDVPARFLPHDGRTSVIAIDWTTGSSSEMMMTQCKVRSTSEHTYHRVVRDRHYPRNKVADGHVDHCGMDGWKGDSFWYVRHCEGSPRNRNSKLHICLELKRKVQITIRRSLQLSHPLRKERPKSVGLSWLDVKSWSRQRSYEWWLRRITWY